MPHFGKLHHQGLRIHQGPFPDSFGFIREEFPIERKDYGKTDK